MERSEPKLTTKKNLQKARQIGNGIGKTTYELLPMIILAVVPYPKSG
jgi:hypothetical protein